jgi:hypothetical protein
MRGRFCVGVTSARLTPQPAGNGKGVKAHVVPPGAFVAGVMKLAVMGATEGDGELVTHLAAQCLRLGKSNVMGVGGDGAADETGLGCDVAQVVLVADAAGFTEGKGAFVDAVAKCG